MPSVTSLAGELGGAKAPLCLFKLRPQLDHPARPFHITSHTLLGFREVSFEFLAPNFQIL